MGRNTNETSHRLAKEGLVNGKTFYLMESKAKAAEEDSRWAELRHLHRFGFLGRKLKVSACEVSIYFSRIVINELFLHINYAFSGAALLSLGFELVKFDC